MLLVSVLWASLSTPSAHLRSGAGGAVVGGRGARRGGDGESVSCDASVCKVPFGWSGAWAHACLGQLWGVRDNPSCWIPESLRPASHMRQGRVTAQASEPTVMGGLCLQPQPGKEADKRNK